MLVKVTARFPTVRGDLLPKEVCVPAGSPVVMCNNFRNNLETGV